MDDNTPHESRSRQNRLAPRFVETVKRPGEYPDGNGLYLRVGPTGSKSFVYRYQIDGETHRMGLRTSGLAEARNRAETARQQVRDGIDPISARNADRLAKRLAAAKQVTFHECAEQWLGAQDFRPKRLQDQRSIVQRFLDPPLGKLPVPSINIDLCEEALKPVWKTRVGLKDVQPCLEHILDWATAKEYRAGDNPARVKKGSPLLIRLGRYKHIEKSHPNLPFEHGAAYMARLRGQRYAPTHGKEGRPIYTYTHEFIILTAVRKKQAVEAKWSEIDWENGLWICPPDRHKTGEETQTDYVIVLSDQAKAILKEMGAWQDEQGIKREYIFVGRVTHDRRGRSSGAWTGEPQHVNTQNWFVKRFWRAIRHEFPPNVPERITTQGFRTTFGDWSVEAGYDERDSEMALGHKVGNAIRNVYKRHAQRIEPRRLMMQAYADYLDRTKPLPAEILPFRKAK
jgi:integrase